ncbi:MAG TPA: FAD-dependent oxidoreductase [Pontiellaceae bacterium]|nr:FAD-dependent oxidoreductase [Pontiellaceae bacterium]
MSKVKEINRRQFIGYSGAAALSLLAARSFAGDLNRPSNGQFLFLEAEGFSEHGGWEIDQQSMDQMGSPYLLAHGLGVPVKDAVAQVQFPSAGTYRVWVRTKDWVAPWNAPGAPGKFQLLINGVPLAETFGTKGAEWHWHNGGTVEVGGTARIALHDLTGFEGRCEAVLFCKDTAFEPVNDVEALTRFRRKLLGFPDRPEYGGRYDLVVVGGGLAGICAALSAARRGLSVALVHDRPVLGGNGSSEVRVWPEGHTNKPPYPSIGDIVTEILKPINKATAEGKWFGTLNGTAASNFDDQRKLDVVKTEPRINLLNNHRAIQTLTSGNRIQAVVIQSIRTGRQQLLEGTFFADCTGDATVGFQAGAEYEYAFSSGNPLMGSSNLFNVIDASNQKDVLDCDCKDKSALMTQYQEGKYEQPFPRCPWALDLSDKPFPGRLKKQATGTLKDLKSFANAWYWESGFDKDQVNDIELIRDHNFRAFYGAWDALKNVDGLYKNFRLAWAAFIAGKRESRRLMGDVVLDGKHFTEMTDWADKAFPCSWHIDLHFPEKKYQAGFEGNEFISDFTRGKDYKYGGLYWAPYRCLYSRNIGNLFMAGRNISVTKTGLGPVRVMKTCGMMGEVIGKAAALCVQHGTTPRGVYENHLAALQEMMKQPGSFRTA